MLMLIKTAVTFTVITAVGGKVKSPTRSEKSAWLCLQKLSQFFFLFVTKKNPEAPQTLKISSSSSCFLNQALDLQWKHSEMLWLMKWIWENIYIRKQCITLGLFAKSICSRFVPSETTTENTTWSNPTHPAPHISRRARNETRRRACYSLTLTVHRSDCLASHQTWCLVY